MPAVRRGNFENPRKSAWNFEIYDSDLERRMMRRLEADSSVCKWTKRHGISISWLDRRHHRHAYRPDFLVEYVDRSVGLIEVKGANLVDSEAVQRKRQAAELWCQRRGMAYSLETVG